MYSEHSNGSPSGDGVPIELPRREGCEGLWVLKLPVWLWQ